MNVNFLPGVTSRAFDGFSPLAEFVDEGRLNDLVQRVKESIKSLILTIADHFSMSAAQPTDFLTPIATFIRAEDPQQRWSAVVQLAIRVAICVSCLKTSGQLGVLPAVSNAGQLLAVMAVATIGLQILSTQAGLAIGGAIGAYALHQVITHLRTPSAVAA